MDARRGIGRGKGPGAATPAGSVPARVVLAGAVLVALAGCAGVGSGSGAAPAVASPSAAGSAAATGGGARASVTDARSRVALAVRGADTVLTSVGMTSVRTGRSLRLPGVWTLPHPVPGAGPEGLSPDGRLVVLAAPAVRGASRFALVPADLSRAARIVSLPDGFEYDALAPDGSVLYLIEHQPARGPDHYAVRAFDTRAMRLSPGVVVDKSRIAEQMAGVPIARALTVGGVVVATLYRKGDGEGFVHLLHARDGFALCADLPGDVGPGWSIRLAGGRFMVIDPGGVSRFGVTPEDATVAALAP